MGIAILAFVPIGIWLILDPDGVMDIVWGVASIILGGVGGGVILHDMIRGSRIATISCRGIDIPDTPFIPWESVVKFEKLGGWGEFDRLPYIQITHSPGGTKTQATEIDPDWSCYTLDEVLEILKEFQELNATTRRDAS